MRADEVRRCCSAIDTPKSGHDWYYIVWICRQLDSQHGQPPRRRLFPLPLARPRPRALPLVTREAGVSFSSSPLSSSSSSSDPLSVPSSDSSSSVVSAFSTLDRLAALVLPRRPPFAVFPGGDCVSVPSSVSATEACLVALADAVSARLRFLGAGDAVCSSNWSSGGDEAASGLATRRWIIASMKLACGRENSSYRSSFSSSSRFSRSSITSRL